ncbi:ANMK-like protein [Mya arenaria]|uniref:ANMK-like protein n=1 Tax=Mya arenaria TaxID=6604 RepID=A0ABY7DPC4_MYAAR|nr:anhydro-N-acetylmuramic acid kinase-like [Mya arenaria]WAQ99547.1 ANMK-like protein [Mya arenaria]
MASFVGVGCMSGSSMDGLDICCVEFTGDIFTDLWGYRILAAETVAYSKQWSERLRDADNLSGIELIRLHVDYGRFQGKCVSTFITKHRLNERVQFVASHGHSVFHKPQEGISFQLGDGEVTAAMLKVPFVCNFRAKDVTIGGQGAPLVPCGEKYLFRNSDICINLGGIANIGIKGMRGYDICPCNRILNSLVLEKGGGQQYDKDGDLARSGDMVPEVLVKLQNLSYYQQDPPKSLWVDYIEENVLPILDCNKYKVENLLRTCTEHVASMVADACFEAKPSIATTSHHPNRTVLITGGGALNKYLVELIGQYLDAQGFEIEQVDEETINFKEALIFAFLGMRCLLGEDNVFSETTGARQDSVSGSIHRPLSSGSAKHISLLH